MKKAFAVLMFAAASAFVAGNLSLSHRAQRHRAEAQAYQSGTELPPQGAFWTGVDRFGERMGDAVVSSALAGDQFLCQLTSSDAGATNVCALPPSSPGAATASGALGQQFDIWCVIPSVFKVDVLTGSSGDGGYVGDAGIFTNIDVPAYTANPAGQANLNSSSCAGLGALPKCRFVSGRHTGIVALAADGGNPACIVSSVVGGG